MNNLNHHHIGRTELFGAANWTEDPDSSPLSPLVGANVEVNQPYLIQRNLLVTAACICSQITCNNLLFYFCN